MDKVLIRRMTLLVVSGVLVVGVTACHSGTSRPVSAPTSASAVTTAAPLSGPAVVKYGQAKVQAAYKEMVKFSFDTGWNPSLIVKHVDLVTRGDFATALAYMTPACAKTFDAAFAKVAKHDKAAIRSLEGAIFFGVKGPNGIVPVKSGKVVTDGKYTQAVVGIDKSHGVERLSISFTAKANIQMQDVAGKHYVVPTSRKARFLLVPNTGADAQAKPFLIAAWSNTMTASHIQPV